jgi:hypothetical protein
MLSAMVRPPALLWKFPERACLSSQANNL